MCPALQGSTVSYAGDAHFAKHSLEYSLNFWSQPKKKSNLFQIMARRLIVLHCPGILLCIGVVGSK